MLIISDFFNNLDYKKMFFNKMKCGEKNYNIALIKNQLLEKLYIYIFNCKSMLSRNFILQFVFP